MVQSIARHAPLALTLAALAFTACSGGAGAPVPPPPNPNDGVPGNFADPGIARLAVVDTFPPKNVKIFDANANGNVPPLFTMSSAAFQLNFPAGAAFDQAGNLYVTNESTPSVTIYSFSSSGTPALVRAIEGPDTGLAVPDAIAVDAAGNVYVSSLVTPPLNAKIDEFAAGASGDAKPIATIVGLHTHLSGPVSLAVDSAGNIFATSGGFFILEFAPGSNGDIAPSAMISENNDDPVRPGGFNGIAVDGSRNVYVRAELFGPGCNQAPAIVKYAPDLRSRISYISGNWTGIPQAPFVHTGTLAVDATGKTFISFPVTPSVWNGPNAISVFAAGVSGNIAPIATITGSATGLEGNQEAIAVQ